jgi:hypothetical protein
MLTGNHFPPCHEASRRSCAVFLDLTKTPPLALTLARKTSAHVTPDQGPNITLFPGGTAHEPAPFIQTNDIQQLSRPTRAHVWHHLIQHKPFETNRPQHHRRGPRHAGLGCDRQGTSRCVSGGVWTVNVGYGRESIADAVRDQLVKMNYFANSRRIDPGRAFRQKS